MFNRTLLTMSAASNGLNLGTRSFAGMADGNVDGGTLRLRTAYPGPRTESLRLGIGAEPSDPSIPGDPWSASIPSSPAVPRQAIQAQSGQPRVAVVVTVLPASPGEVVHPDAHPCAPCVGKSGRWIHARHHASKAEAPGATQRAAQAGRTRMRGRRPGFDPLMTTTTLTAPDALSASGG